MIKKTDGPFKRPFGLGHAGEFDPRDTTGFRSGSAISDSTVDDLHPASPYIVHALYYQHS